jgi:hypothetical protein
VTLHADSHVSRRTEDEATRAHPRKPPHRWTREEASVAGRKGGQAKKRPRRSKQAQ